MTRYVKTLELLRIDVKISSDLERFATLFVRWNASINLSAARTPEELDEHVRDSLQVVPFLTAGRCLDVGSGGGFPVVIASICRPDIQFVSLEPVHKKHAFLRTAARELGLANLEPIADRLENHEIFEYDVAMSRATFDLNDWLSRGLSHVRPGGIVIGFEGIQRPDLPDSVERHPYELDKKSRAIVIARREPSP
jgi:16S rRNA (guanine(527)-N(7))-methyltransferase RsmG